MAASPKRTRNPYRPGTASYAKRREEELRRKETLARARAARAKRPEVRQRAQRQATAARSAIKKIETREQARAALMGEERAAFNRLPIRLQDPDQLAKEVLRRYPNGVPSDVPDPFGELGAYGRGRGWNRYYTRQARTARAQRRFAA